MRNILWNAYRRTAEKSQKAATDRASHKVIRLNQTVSQLEDKIDQLALTCQALWEVVRDQTGLDDSDILEKLNEVDLRDGKADGKMSPRTRSCAKCERVLHARHRRCMYCGASAPAEDLFDL